MTDLPEGIDYKGIKRIGDMLRIPFNREATNDDAYQIAEALAQRFDYKCCPAYLNENRDQTANFLSPEKGFAPHPQTGMSRHAAISQPYLTVYLNEDNKTVSVFKHQLEDIITFEDIQRIIHLAQ